MKSLLSIVIGLILFTTTAGAGWFWNDPVELTAQPEQNLLSADRIHIRPSGAHQYCLIRDVACTLKATYSDGRVSKVALKFDWVSSDKPMTFSLPYGYSGLHSYSVTGTCWYLLSPKQGAKLPEGVSWGTATPKQKLALFDNKTGYKIDSEWRTQ